MEWGKWERRRKDRKKKEEMKRWRKRREKERKISYIGTAITVEVGVDLGGRTLCQKEHCKEIEFSVPSLVALSIK